MSEDDLKNLKELKSKNKPRVLTMYFEDGGETSVVPYDDYENLEQENQQLKEQLKSKKQELKGFTNAIAEYLGSDDPKHTFYDEIFDKINQLKIKSQQRKEVIEEAIKKCELEIRASSSQYERNHKQQDLVYKVAHKRILDILNKYENRESE